MGRIKTKPIKSAGDRIWASYADKISKDFEENKRILPQLAEVRSKKIRNVLAGYLTKKAKRGG